MIQTSVTAVAILIGVYSTMLLVSRPAPAPLVPVPVEVAAPRADRLLSFSDRWVPPEEPRKMVRTESIRAEVSTPSQVDDTPKVKPVHRKKRKR